jgi:hypothetical protein
MFPKTGNKFPRAHSAIRPGSPYAQLVAAALRSSLDDTHRAIKTVMVWTRANERTVKNWLSGTNGPNGDYLLVLLGKSDAVVDALIGTLPQDRLTELAIRLVRRVGGDDRWPSSTKEQSEALTSPAIMSVDRLDQSNRRIVDPNDPDHDPKGDPDSTDGHTDLNPRQLWFLRQLNSGRPMRANDLQREHNVSEKTAKRDIARLRRLNMIKYVGSHRKGQYMSTQLDIAAGTV